jgi:ferredoxin
MKCIITKGNNKLGLIPNSSIIPIKDCVNCEWCKDYCYANKFIKRYPTVKRAWEYNSFIAHNELDTWVDNHYEYVSDNKPAYFRYFVGGDIISEDMFSSIIDIARSNNATTFLLFTKAFEYIAGLYRSIPENLNVKLSIFPGMSIPCIDLPIARTIFKGDAVPMDYDMCSGSCIDCKKCFNSNCNIAFKKH